VKTWLVVIGICLVGSTLASVTGRAVGPDWGYTLCFCIGVVISGAAVSWIWTRP